MPHPSATTTTLLVTHPGSLLCGLPRCVCALLHQLTSKDRKVKAVFHLPQDLPQEAAQRSEGVLALPQETHEHISHNLGARQG